MKSLLDQNLTVDESQQKKDLHRLLSDSLRPTWVVHFPNIVFSEEVLSQKVAEAIDIYYGGVSRSKDVNIRCKTELRQRRDLRIYQVLEEIIDDAKIFGFDGTLKLGKTGRKIYLEKTIEMPANAMSHILKFFGFEVAPVLKLMKYPLVEYKKTIVKKGLIQVVVFDRRLNHLTAHHFLKYVKQKERSCESNLSWVLDIFN